jgi:RND family efflux transporter MFP subunit
VTAPNAGRSVLLDRLRIDRGAPRPPRRGKRFAGLGIALVVTLAAGLGLLAGLPRAIPVRVAVARAAMPTGSGQDAAASLLDASGYVVALRQATVSGKIIDRVIEVPIEAGQHVIADQVVARLDDSNIVAALDLAAAQLDQARADFAVAKAALEDAEPIFRRSEKLIAAGWISATAFDNSRATYHGAQTGLSVARSKLDVAERALAVAQRNEDDTVIRSPFSGVVTVKNAQPGEIVSPQYSGGGGLATIVDMTSLEVQVDVSENFISRVHPGQPATIKLNAYPSWQIPAAVIAIIPTADQSKATVKVRVGFKQSDERILPQMGAHVSFLEDTSHRSDEPSGPAVTIIPADAMQGSGDFGAVFEIVGSQASRRTVRLGPRVGDDQTILSGLQPGAHIAVGDLSRLTDGARISVRD